MTNLEAAKGGWGGRKKGNMYRKNAFKPPTPGKKSFGRPTMVGGRKAALRAAAAALRAAARGVKLNNPPKP